MGVYLTGDCHGDWERINAGMYSVFSPLSGGEVHPKDFSSMKELYEQAYEMQSCGLSYFRIKGMTWRPDELPTSVGRGSSSIVL